MLDQNFMEAETFPELSRMQHLTTPFALDEQYPKLRYGTHTAPYYPPAVSRNTLPWVSLVKAVLAHRRTFDYNLTVYLIADNRKPKDAPHWPPFCVWWASTRELKGPANEATDIVWIHATGDLDEIPYYWTGPLLVWIARWLFPACNIILIDNDSVPLTLFKVSNLIKLRKQLPHWHHLITEQEQEDSTIGMILVTEPHFEHNAGLVVSPAGQHAPPNLQLPPDQLNLTTFLDSSSPPTNPTTAATSGLLHTPLLGVRCRDPLHHCMAWAALGIYMIHTMWPPPGNRHSNRNNLRTRLSRYSTHHGRQQQSHYAPWRSTIPSRHSTRPPSTRSCPHIACIWTKQRHGACTFTAVSATRMGNPHASSLWSSIQDRSVAKWHLDSSWWTCH